MQLHNQHKDVGLTLIKANMKSEEKLKINIGWNIHTSYDEMFLKAE